MDTEVNGDAGDTYLIHCCMLKAVTMSDLENPFFKHHINIISQLVGKDSFTTLIYKPESRTALALLGLSCLLHRQPIPFNWKCEMHKGVFQHNFKK